jgi:hypothetical protein
MRRHVLAAALPLATLLLACGSTPVAVHTAGPSASASPAAQSPSLQATSSPSPSPSASLQASPSSEPSTPPLTVTVSCHGKPAGGALALLGRDVYPDFASAADLYDVTNPLAPRLICTIGNTSSHLLSNDTIEYLRPTTADKTEVVVRSITTGVETTAATLPFATRTAAWTSDGAVVAYRERVPAGPNDYSDHFAVWLFAAGHLAQLYSYPTGIGDCICRFGLPHPVLAISPDGQYLVSGWIAGKGSVPLVVYRLSDRRQVATLDASVYNALWAGSGHRLFLVSFSGVTPCCVQSWTPEAGLSPLPNASQWFYDPSLSPGGGQVAFTAYADPSNQTSPRVYVYDLAGQQTRLLIDQPRADGVFVKDDWVWYGEDVVCADCPNGTTPSGRIFAMQLSTHAESLVTFTPGEQPQTGAPWSPAGYWPA